MTRKQFEAIITPNQCEDFFVENEPEFSQLPQSSHANAPHCAIYRLDDGWIVMGQDKRAGVGTVGLEFQVFTSTYNEAITVAAERGFTSMRSRGGAPAPAAQR